MLGRIAASVRAVAPEERGSQAGEVQAAPDRWLEGRSTEKEKNMKPTTKQDSS